MKTIFFILSFILINDLHGQILGIDETIIYLNSVFQNKNKMGDNYLNIWTSNKYRIKEYDGCFQLLQSGNNDGYKYGDTKNFLSISVKDGKLSLTISYFDGSGSESNILNMDEIDFIFNEQITTHTYCCGKSYYFKVRNICGNYHEYGPGILIYCNNSQYSSCIDGMFAISIQHKAQDPYTLKKIYNALKYLKGLSETEGKFLRDNSDPFSDDKFFEKMETYSAKSSTIALKNNNNMFSLTADILGVGSYDFLYDTGASTVTINEEIEKKLWATKIINKESYVSSALYKIADGSIVEARRLKIPKLTIGTLALKDVIVAVTNGDLLFSNSAFKGFSKFLLDKEKKTLNISE